MSKPIYFELDNLDHDQEIAITLGNLVVAWSSAEIMLGVCMTHVFNVEVNMGLNSFFLIPTFESRTKFLRMAIVGWENPKKLDKEKLDRIIEKYTKLSLQRNSWIHNSWCKHHLTNRTVVVSTKKIADRVKIVNANSIAQHNKAVNEQTSLLSEMFPGHR